MRVLTTTTAAILLSALMSNIHASGLEFSKIKGHDFSLGDVQKECMAHRVSGNELEITCKPKNMKAVNRSCVGYIQGGLEDVRLTCRGTLWVVSNKCKVKMLGAKKGEMSCAF